MVRPIRSPDQHGLTVQKCCTRAFICRTQRKDVAEIQFQLQIIHNPLEVLSNFTSYLQRSYITRVDLIGLTVA